MTAGGTVRRVVRWLLLTAFAAYALVAAAGMLQLPRYLVAFFRGDLHP
ncbi:hypothetical protein [Kitasatospora sp. NPDC057198]